MRAKAMLTATGLAMVSAFGCDDEEGDGNGVGGSPSGGTGGMDGTGGAVTGGTGGAVTGGMGGLGGMVGADLEIGIEQVVTGLTSPVVLRDAPDGTQRLFVADQVGTIHVIDEAGELLEDPFLDLSGSMVELMESFDERGLLGLAFHPEYEQNGRFFVYYSVSLGAGAPDDFNHTSRISEFQVSEGDPDVADSGSERIVLEVHQPQFNHNAGQILFGPDGYLYIPLGDGGAADDVGTGHVEDWYEANGGGNGQDIEQNLLGSILRIDVDGETPYEVPADNPFADSAMPEVWAFGFRNPFRMSFDSGGDNELFVADVGQNLWEEVSIVEAEGNYGWNVKEGTHCFSTDSPNDPPETCPDTGDMDEPLLDPILEYSHPGQDNGIGISVIGGFVYRGEDVPDLSGRYVFGDWSTSTAEADGTLLVASEGAGSWSMEELEVAGRDSGRLGEYLLSFGEDAAGELYILTTQNGGPTGSTGSVYRLVAP